MEVSVTVGLSRGGKRHMASQVCVIQKKLTNKGIHSFVSMVGYYLKDEGEFHFQMRYKNITEDMMKDGRQLHMLLGCSFSKNMIELTSHNILQCALQFNRYNLKRPLSNSLFGCISQMMSSGQYIPSPGWLMDKGLDRRRSTSIWKACLDPRSATSYDIHNIYFCLKSVRYYEKAHPRQYYFGCNFGGSDGGPEAGASSSEEDERPPDRACWMPDYIPLCEALTHQTRNVSLEDDLTCREDL